jgi:hypothetical protein
MMNLTESQKVFMRALGKLSATSRVNYPAIHQFFENLIIEVGDNAPAANPLRVKGSASHIHRVYLTQIKHYIFQLTTIRAGDSDEEGMFDTQKNSEIRKTYMVQIATFLKVLPEFMHDALLTGAPIFTP